MFRARVGGPPFGKAIVKNRVGDPLVKNPVGGPLVTNSVVNPLVKRHVRPSRSKAEGFRQIVVPKIIKKTEATILNTDQNNNFQKQKQYWFCTHNGGTSQRSSFACKKSPKRK